MGNSSYGKTITNQLKHRNVENCSDAEASRKVNTHLFRKLENITEDIYEVESCKKNHQVKFTDSTDSVFSFINMLSYACYNFIMIF